MTGPSLPLRLAIATLAFVMGLLIGEVFLRLADGFRVFAIRLVPATMSGFAPAPGGEPQTVSRYVERTYPRGIRSDWFQEGPPPLPPHPLLGALRTRHDRYPRDPYAAFFEWNINYLRQQACAGSLPDVLTTVSDYLFFTPPGRSLYPTYRHSRDASPPGWFTSNAFGWRGPEIELNKPQNTIRIAFVGASTTIGAYDFPYSYPELIQHWLNLWSRSRGWTYRFEAINAGRTGIDSHSIAAIVRDELLPVDPDLIVYYEGSNQFWPADHLRYRFGRIYPRPRVTLRVRLGEDTSAFMRRSWRLADRLIGGDGREPLKPLQTVVWPEGVDEMNPDPDDPRLPIQLPIIVKDLDAIRSAIEGTGGELVLSSFIWMAEPGIKLDLERDVGLFRYLNETYWPISYANLRRFADFQNRVFERYARRHDLPFLDVSGAFPRDPELFGDAIHLRYDGLRYQGWLYFEALTSLIEDRLGSGALPRAAAVVRDHHPAFEEEGPKTIALTELLSHCG